MKIVSHLHLGVALGCATVVGACDWFGPSENYSKAECIAGVEDKPCPEGSRCLEDYRCHALYERSLDCAALEACTDGVCRDPESLSCAGSGDCPDADWFCDTARQCRKRVANGGDCAGEHDSCQGGFCTDGVCCERACDGVCYRCDGEARGICAAVVGYQLGCNSSAAAEECPSPPCSCGYDGVCKRDGGRFARRMTSAPRARAWLERAAWRAPLRRVSGLFLQARLIRARSRVTAPFGAGARSQVRNQRSRPPAFMASET